MISNILFILWFAFILLLLSSIARKALHCSSICPFINYGTTDIPYISLSIQGFELNFIIDTGCGVSIIRKDMLSNLDYADSSRKVQLSALTSDSLHADMVTIPIMTNSRQVEEDFVVYDQEDIANFQALYGITIHGILGNEFLERTGCQIDYKNHIVVIP